MHAAIPDTGAVSGRSPPATTLRCDRLRSQRRNGQNRRATAPRPGGYRFNVRTCGVLAKVRSCNFTNYHGGVRRSRPLAEPGVQPAGGSPHTARRAWAGCAECAFGGGDTPGRRCRGRRFGVAAPCAAGQVSPKVQLGTHIVYQYVHMTVKRTTLSWIKILCGQPSLGKHCERCNRARAAGGCRAAAAPAADRRPSRARRGTTWTQTPPPRCVNDDHLTDKSAHVRPVAGATPPAGIDLTDSPFCDIGET